MSCSRTPSDDDPVPWAWQDHDAWLRLIYAQLGRLLIDGFLLDESLRLRSSASGNLTLRGVLTCRHRLEVQVSITFERRGDDMRILKCKYHAAVADPHRAIFRYDDAHSRPGHPDHLHKHVFDPPGAPDPGTVVWIGRDNWPTLFDVVRELQEWWEETGCRLPLRSG